MKSLFQKLSTLLRDRVALLIPQRAVIILHPTWHRAHRSRPPF